MLTVKEKNYAMLSFNCMYKFLSDCRWSYSYYLLQPYIFFFKCIENLIRSKTNFQKY